jgi:hypothetical protein
MKSAEYTIERMRPTEHSAESWDSLFGCADEDRRNYKLMYNGRAIETELTFKEAHEWKMHYEAEDAYAREEEELYEKYPESFVRL